MAMLCTVSNSFGPGLFGSFGGSAPVLDELAVAIELGDAGAAVPVADEERAVGQPVDVGRPIEQLAGIAPALAHRPERQDELAVVW